MNAVMLETEAIFVETVPTLICGTPLLLETVHLGVFYSATAYGNILCINAVCQTLRRIASKKATSKLST